MWDKALVYLRQAGSQAAARSANREAVAAFEEARAVLPHLPDTPARQEQEIDLFLDLRTPLHALGDLARGHECTREAERLALRLGDSRRLARACVYLCHYSRLAGALGEAVASGRWARAIAQELDDPPLAVAASFSLGLVHSYTGDYQEAEALLREAMLAAVGASARDFCGLDGLPSVMAPGHLARVLAECGRFEEGTRLGREAIRIAERLDHPYSLVMACWGLGWLHNVRGEVDAAITPLERALAVATRWECVVWFPNVWEQLGYAYARAHRIEEGLELLERAIKTYEAAGRHPLTMHLGEAYILAGRFSGAAEHAERMLVRSRAGGERRMEALALHVLAAAQMQGDPAHVEQSRETYRQALTLAEKLSMRPLAARCLLGLI